jgi:hypothetical protein
MAAAQTMLRGSDLALLTAGGMLLTSALRRAEDTAIAASRALLLRRVDLAVRNWRHRYGNVASLLGMLIGGAVVVHAVHRVRRDRANQSSGTESDSTDPDAIIGPSQIASGE